MARRSMQAKTSVAYHEAGHAVMAYEQRLRIREVSILPEATSAGHVDRIAAIIGERPDIGRVTDRVRMKVERDVLVALAGATAQRIRNPRSVRAWHGESDRAVAEGLLAHISPDFEELVAYLNLLDIRARVQLEHFLTWPAVEALAAALLERKVLTGTEARRVIRDAKRAALDSE